MSAWRRMIRPTFSPLQALGYLIMGLVLGFLLGLSAYPHVVTP